ncbi:MAG: serine/threonine-protein kinase, partial [bacterium]
APAPDDLFVSFQRAVIGRYSLERELGRGGMGVVYLAREVRLDRLVAIKVLPPEFTDRADLRDRFMREARTAAGLSHPYIVPIHAVDDADGFAFIVMAYVNGGTLAQRVATHGPLPARDVTRIMREVAWALAYAHAQGIVHRDIKPANILLEQGTGRAMVADFGIARLTESGGDTAAGMVLGTPEFMSPEQAAAETLDGRSDLYALGIVAYYALTGTLPFTAPTSQAVLAMQLTRAPVPAATAARGAPRELTDAIDTCLEKAPESRFANGEALVDALEQRAERSSVVPVPVRVFLDRRRMALLLAGLFVPSVLTLGVTTALMRTAAWAVPFAGVAGLLVAVGLPLGILTFRLRRLLRLGYGRDDIAAGLRLSFERRREEFIYEFGVQPNTREKVFRVVGISGLVIGATAVAGMIATGGSIAGTVAPVAAIGLYAGVMATAFSSKWRRLRAATGSFWSKFWNGKLGERLVSIASYKLGERAVPADRPTEMAIAMSAEAMFGTLPRAIRESLGDVPAILHELEGHARVARARIDELDAAIAEAQHGRGAQLSGSSTRQETLIADLTDRRERAGGRLAELVTALENVRLDLLRVRAGGGSVESITRDLAAAREFGKEADRLLASGREVEDALRVDSRDRMSG